MSSSRKSLIDNWLLVEWNCGGRNVIFIRSVVSPVDDLKVGEALTANRRGEPQPATLIASANERDLLDNMLKKEEAGPSEPTAPAEPAAPAEPDCESEQPKEEEEEEGDFSSSASSWVPSEDDVQSGDSAEVPPKKIKLERYKRQYSNRSSKKVLVPSNKANAVQNVINRKRQKDKPNDSTKVLNMSMNKSAPDSTKINQIGTSKVTIDVLELSNIHNTFDMLFNVFKGWRQHYGVQDAMPCPMAAVHKTEEPEMKNEETMNNFKNELHQSSDENKENVNNVSASEEFNRSDDNVLISNKYSNVGVRTNNLTADGEWVPIGSGKTLIHKDKFKKVNWKSYTIATRTLLLAAFPRRILATHSLTGKRSPAFQNKPAKMCLDPKVTSDVIMEIMDRFNVRENLVRSIITTKCADECKMWKTRLNKKKANKKQENIPTEQPQVTQ